MACLDKSRPVGSGGLGKEPGFMLASTHLRQPDAQMGIRKVLSDRLVSCWLHTTVGPGMGSQL